MPPGLRRVCLAGGTGFTGGFVVRELLGHSGIECSLFVRDAGRRRDLGDIPSSCRIVEGDLDRPESLRAALLGADIFICTASLGFGHASGIVQACVEAGVARCLFVSTTSIYTGLNVASKTVRIDAENAIRASGLRYTIIRPTMIYGTIRDRNMCRLIRVVRRSPILVIPGPGTFLVQPVHVADLADGIVRAAFSDTAIRKEYAMSGREPLTFNEVVDTVSRCLGKKTLKLHIPLGFTAAIIGLHERISRRPRLRVEQLMRLNEHKAFGHEQAASDLGFSPRDFQTGIASEIAELYPPRA